MARGGKRPGAGRPKGEEPTVVITARIPESLASELDAWIESRQLNRSVAVTKAVQKLLGSSAGKRRMGE